MLTVDDYGKIRRAHREGMSVRAIDALNDWAFEKFGGQLFVDDGSRFLVQHEYLN